jgi:hypothetical protein
MDASSVINGMLGKIFIDIRYIVEPTSAPWHSLYAIIYNASKS